MSSDSQKTPLSGRLPVSPDRHWLERTETAGINLIGIRCNFDFALVEAGENIANVIKYALECQCDRNTDKELIKQFEIAKPRIYHAL